MINSAFVAVIHWAHLYAALHWLCRSGIRRHVASNSHTMAVMRRGQNLSVKCAEPGTSLDFGGTIYVWWLISSNQSINQ